MVGGIPRFVAHGAGAGTDTATNGSRLLDDARKYGWPVALNARFGDDETAITTATDWQSVAWLPMLGARGDINALVINCGFGGIASALSRNVQSLVAIDVNAESVEFTQVRLQEEKVGNVQIAQASINELPLLEHAFDLVVIAGAIQWTTDERGAPPRSFELDAMRQVYNVMQPGAVLVYGTENWFSHKIRRPTDAGTTAGPWPRARVRSRRGNASLVRRSGFHDIETFWADPGYRQPYNLIPLRGTLPSEHIRLSVTEPTQSMGRNWRRGVKSAAARLGLVSYFIHDFLIIARKSEVEGALAPGSWRAHLWKRVRDGMPAVPQITDPIVSLITHPFARRTLIRVTDAAAGPTVMLKASTNAPDSLESLDAEYRALKEVSRLHDQLANPMFVVAMPLGRSTIGRLTYTAESAVGGVPLSQLVFSLSGKARNALLRRELFRAVDTSIGIAQMLKAGSAPPAQGDWLEVPRDLLDDVRIQELSTLAKANAARRGGESFVRHGDFTIENIFIDEPKDTVGVIDWENLVSGVPALYDVYSLLVSALPAVEATDEAINRETAPLSWSFATAFFGDGYWTDLYRELALHACERQGVPATEAWPQFVQFLLSRIHYYDLRGSGMRVHHVAFLQQASQLSGRFLALPSRG